MNDIEFLKSLAQNDYMIDTQMLDDGKRLEKIAKNIVDMLEVLTVFADMHREGSDPTEVACQRGTASDLTIITSGDFAKAYKVYRNIGCLDEITKLAQENGEYDE